MAQLEHYIESLFELKYSLPLDLLLYSLIEKSISSLITETPSQATLEEVYGLKRTMLKILNRIQVRYEHFSREDPDKKTKAKVRLDDLLIEFEVCKVKVLLCLVTEVYQSIFSIVNKDARKLGYGEPRTPEDPDEKDLFQQHLSHDNQEFIEYNVIKRLKKILIDLAQAGRIDDMRNELDRYITKLDELSESIEKRLSDQMDPRESACLGASLNATRTLKSILKSLRGKRKL